MEHGGGVRAGIINAMVSPKVIETNKYLQDPDAMEKAILQSVKSSSAIEGIVAPFEHGAPKPIAHAKLESAVFPER